MLKTVGWIVVAVALTAGVTAYLGSTGSRGPEASGAAPPATAVVRVENREPSVLATGVLRPEIGAEVRVGSRVSGVLEELHVTVGDTVRRGQLLAVLDPTEFEARRAEIVAELEAARVEQKFAGKDLARARSLIVADAITPTELESYERAEALARAAVVRLEASLASTEIQLDYTRIVAPIAGVVADVAVQVGETVAASFAAPTFVTIIDLDRLEVWAYVDETDIGRVRVGQRATFTVDTYPGRQFEGVVSALRPQAEIVDDVVNYVTEITITPVAGYTLRPEMTARVNIMTDSDAVTGKEGPR